MVGVAALIVGVGAGAGGSSVPKGGCALSAGVGPDESVGTSALEDEVVAKPSGTRLRTSSPAATNSRPPDMINHGKRRRAFISLRLPLDYRLTAEETNRAIPTCSGRLCSENRLDNSITAEVRCGP